MTTRWLGLFTCDPQLYEYSAGLLYEYDIMLEVYNSQQEFPLGPIEWSKLILASCVIHDARSLGALVLSSICSLVFVNYYDMVVDTRFDRFYDGSFARVLYGLLK